MSRDLLNTKQEHLGVELQKREGGWGMMMILSLMPIHPLVQNLISMLGGDYRHKYKCSACRISFVAQTKDNKFKFTLYYTRTGYISAMIMDLQYSQNYKTTAVQILRLSTNHPIFLISLFCTVKLTFKTSFFHFSVSKRHCYT